MTHQPFYRSIFNFAERVDVLVLLKEIQDVFTIVNSHKELIEHQSQVVGGNVNLVVLPQHALKVFYLE